MANLDFDQIPAQEQMVDNWGQPTPWMQSLWQRLTEQIRAQIGEVAQAAQAANAAAEDAESAAALAQQGVNDAFAAQQDASSIISYLASLLTYQQNLNSYLFACSSLLLELITVLDDPTQPLSPPVVFSSFVNYPLPSIPTPPTPPT